MDSTSEQTDGDGVKPEQAAADRKRKHLRLGFSQSEDVGYIVTSVGRGKSTFEKAHSSKALQTELIGSRPY